ncbi:hypothetical protein SADUNF_Sadunf03G0145300 [Salix dunnii]|uniref:Uncharacterized protein n=1 Tax=Salix dunnii TaxID=1413687 RepID=A0A835N4X3_9ROSI|nr:hypothetical protein SADUNF_Sadunf03G0145300 [Salix dunnii]
MKIRDKLIQRIPAYYYIGVSCNEMLLKGKSPSNAGNWIPDPFIEIKRSSIPVFRTRKAGNQILNLISQHAFSV